MIRDCDFAPDSAVKVDAEVTCLRDQGCVAETD